MQPATTSHAADRDEPKIVEHRVQHTVHAALTKLVDLDDWSKLSPNSNRVQTREQS
jgi:hypothetical protein